MRMKKNAGEGDGGLKLVGKSRFANWWIHMIFIIMVSCCILPIALTFIISFTDEKSLYKNGYSFIPEKWSIRGYEVLLQDSTAVIQAYGVTILSAAIGTFVGMFLTSMVAYVISRRDYKYKKLVTFYIFFTMLFGAGLVPSYLVYTQIFDIRNTMLPTILSGLVGAWNVMMMKSYFMQNIPESLVESAYLDGANDFKIYLRIVLPLSTPMLGAIGFMTVLGYWNSWYPCKIYVSDPKLYTLSYLMTKALLDIQAVMNAPEVTRDMLSAMANMPTETTRMAMAVMGFAPMLVVFPFFRKYFVKGITVGSVKG